MKNKWIRVGAWVACFVLATVPPDVRAEDIEKRWRLGFALGLADSTDSVRSDSANILAITDFDDIPIRFFEDPRNDDAQQLTLQIETRTAVEFSAQYAATKMFIIEFSGGYKKGDVGDVELQVEFSRDPIPVEDRFKFNVFKIPAGEIEQVPLNVTALVRFRPRASFNPYIGVGMGYTFIGFEPSSELSSPNR